MHKEDRKYFVSSLRYKLAEAKALGLCERGIADFIFEEMAESGFIIERSVHHGYGKGRKPSRLTRFFAHFTPEPNTGCWLWTGPINAAGYGQHMGKSAHRWSFVAHGGKLRGKQQVDHTCGQPGCVNPAHLEAVSRQENLRRMRHVRSLARAHAYALAGGYVADRHKRKSRSKAA